MPIWRIPMRPFGFWISFPVIWVGLQYLIAPWIIERVLDIHWDKTGQQVHVRTQEFMTLDLSGNADTQLPACNREFIEKLCADRGLKVPRIGIIESGTPNAFSFGRTTRDARVVVTSGLLKILTPEEANAVLAHEIGHIEHWDFAVMTLAALAPMLLYQLYVVTEKINNFRVVAYSAYVCYLISQFIVLLLNRTREYFADHYAAEVTHAPDDLSSALVKIAYGMVRENGEYLKAKESKSSDEKSYWSRQRRLGGAIALMGISNLKPGASLALGANPKEASAVMRWDLVNPWARFYELNSTHPLTALRVRELNRKGEALRQATRYMLPQGESVHWGRFPLELLVWAAPLLGIGALISIYWFSGALTGLGITVPAQAPPLLLIIIGLSWIIKVLYRYRGKFEPATVGTLLEDLEVSQMRPRAVQLKGKIIGRGEPGAFWSPDLVLRDATGILFILYRQSIPFARFLFGTAEAEAYTEQEVVVEGWFRRGMTPYVEMSKISDGYNVHRTYSRWIQIAVALAAIAIGWFWLRW